MSASTTEARAAAPGAVPAANLASRMVAPITVAAVLVMLIVPLSPTAISMMFALNISAGLVIVAAAMYVQQPAEFLAFPSVLLGTTLMRLALNVATARAILLDGYTGTGAAGRVVEAFGSFVVGGNYVVGFIIFLILIVINLVVVTKGSSRVAEVSARFMLDSLPGRQMAIDADVNAGAFTAKQAEGRREQLRREADFFGAMDGASKFVRGDAIAAIIILSVNLIGGLLIGTLQHGLPIGVAAHTYTLLTVGDGVAAQIPSLAISVAAGLIVTRVATGEDISTQVIQQISRYPQALWSAGGLLTILGLMPGMAHLPFLLFGSGLVGLGIRMSVGDRRERAKERAPDKAEPPAEGRGPDVASVQKVDPFGLEIGFALVSLIQQAKGGGPTLLGRLTAVRQQYSRRMGFVVPNIHVRDAAGLRPQEYAFTIRGAAVAKGDVVPDQMLAIETPEIVSKIGKGRHVKDPVYGQDAVWIPLAKVQEAETLGYTVAEPAAVIATHLGFVLDRYGWEMLGRPEVDELLIHQAKLRPKVVEELRNRVQPGTVRQVLQTLLAEGVSIKDFERITDAIVDASDAVAKDPDRLLAHVRLLIGRQIVSRFADSEQVLRVLVLEPQLEALVHKAVATAKEHGFGQIIEPATARLLRAAATQGQQTAERLKLKPVLAVQSAIRRPVARCLDHLMAVIAAEEIPQSMNVVVIDAIRPPNAEQKAEAGRAA
ncbi:MAG TPA: flagellar biosynthesis protein FlhA [Acetobacteraceae bacterium]|nr:flagellar biosynthesis protein FlhA [Acetobacteraceae bacterium]